MEAVAETGGDRLNDTAVGLTPPCRTSGSIEDVLSRLPAPQLRPSTISRDRCSCSFTFPHPLFEEDDFQLRVDTHNVMLEFCVHGGNTDTVTGYVRVRNLAFHKYVGARFTRDGWATWKEVPAVFLKSDEEGHTDRFVFELPVGHSSQGSCIEFAVHYCVNGREYWDNNNEDNYKITL